MSTSNAAIHAEFDAVVVGAGFAGMAMVRKLVEQGFTVRGIERGIDVGGTWYWNRYPGARCDAPSMQYSYQFSEALQQEWHWKEIYASQSDILEYLNHVADRFGIREHFQFETSVESAHFDDTTEMWTITTDRGDRYRARYCVMATGNLSSHLKPRFKGLDDFEGDWYYTANWPHEPVDFSGKRVGVVGTGSSGVQAIPVIAETAKTLSVFQRTPQYSLPARNRPLDPEYEARIKSDYGGFRARCYRKPLAMDVPFKPGTPKTFDVDASERRARFEAGWEQGGFYVPFAFADLTNSMAANEELSAYLRDKISEVVDDPQTARLLTPDHVFSCKRPIIDTHYFETYNQPHVTLVDCSAGIDEITHEGIRVGDQNHELDVIVFATGFDAITGTLNRIDIRGRKGLKLRDKWEAGPVTYLGLQSSGFPNLFTISGPGSPSVLTNMVPTIEQHVNWIGDSLVHLRDHKLNAIEATPEAEVDWMGRVQALADRTLWGACDNWYVGANVPGKPRVFPLYVDWVSYMQKCEEVVANGYEGFSLS